MQQESHSCWFPPLTLPDHFLSSALCVPSDSLYMLLAATRGLITKTGGALLEAAATTLRHIISGGTLSKKPVLPSDVLQPDT